MRVVVGGPSTVEAGEGRAIGHGEKWHEDRVFPWRKNPRGD